MCNTAKCPSEDVLGECMMKPFDPKKCPAELLWDGDIGECDIPQGLRDAS